MKLNIKQKNWDWNPATMENRCSLDL